MTNLEIRMPLPRDEDMDAIQRSAAAELIAGPRGGVKGPFIPLLRSPELMTRLQKVGEYLRFESALPPRIGEFVTLIISRQWTQQFEWYTHVPLALRAGTERQTIDALREGRRPEGMSDEEALAYDVTSELLGNHGICDSTYRKAVSAFGERGLIDLIGVIGYFTWISMVLNVAHTPPEPTDGAAGLPPTPL